jgi:tetratricopeptide (TPR) repeat protein
MLILVALAAAIASPPQSMQTGAVNQKSSGPCTYNAAAVQGSSTVIIICPGLDSGPTRVLNERLAKQNQELTHTLNTLITAEEWRRKYQSLVDENVSLGLWTGQNRRITEFLNAGEFDKAKSLLAGLIQEYATDSDHLADIYYTLGLLGQLQFDPKSALDNFELAYRYRPDKYALAYGEALLMQGKHSQSESVLETALSHLQDLVKLSPAKHTPALAVALNDVANAYTFNNKLEKAEQFYKKAVDIRRSLSRSNPRLYEMDLGITLTNLGSLYGDTDRPTEALRYFQEALAIYDRAAKIPNSGYEQWLAMTQENMGNTYDDLYTQTGKGETFNKAKEFMERSIRIRESLSKSRPLVFAPSIAQTLNNLANLYKFNDQLDEAKNTYERASVVAQKAADINPADRWIIAMILSNTGDLYLDFKMKLELQHFAERVKGQQILGTQEYLKKAESSFVESLTIYEELAKAEPRSYRKEVSIQLLGLSRVYDEMGRSEDAFAKEMEALQIAVELANDNPDIASYQRDASLELRSVAGRFWKRGWLDRAEQSYRQAIKTVENLPKDENRHNEQALAEALTDFINFLSETNRIEEILEMERRLIVVYSDIVTVDPEYKWVLEEAHKNLADLEKQSKLSK